MFGGKRLPLVAGAGLEYLYNLTVNIGANRLELLIN